MANPEYDFYSPFFAAAIITATGERVPLFTNTNAQGAATSDGEKIRSLTAIPGVQTGLVSLPFLESLTVQLDLAYLPKITAVLTPPFAEGRAILNSSLVEYGQSYITVQLGYSSGTPKGAVLSLPMEGLLQLPDVNMGMDFTITLNAFAPAGYSSQTTQSSVQFNDWARADIIEAVARGAGTPQRDLNVNFDAVKTSSEAYRLLYKDPVTKDQGWLTDWMFMWQMIRDAGCWMIMVGNTIQVFERNTSLATDPKYTLRLFDLDGGKLGPIKGEFPILSVSSPSVEVFLPGSTKMLVAQGIDSPTGKIINDKTTDATVAGNRVGAGAVDIKPSKNNPGVNKTTGNGGGPLSLDVNSKDRVAQAKAEYQANFNMGVQLEILTLGIPNILPGEVVSVKGVGARYDTTYSIFTVFHSIGTAGFTTKLSLRSNTSKVLTDLLAAQGSVNADKPPSAEDLGKHEATPVVQPSLAPGR